MKTLLTVVIFFGLKLYELLYSVIKSSLVILVPYLLGIILIHFDISSFSSISPEESKMMKLFLIYVQGVVYAGFIAAFIGMSFLIKSEIKDLWNYYYKKVKSK